MDKLTAGQKKILAEFSINLAVAWLISGFIAPFFSLDKGIEEVLPIMGMGLILAIFSMNAALYFAKETE